MIWGGRRGQKNSYGHRTWGVNEKKYGSWYDISHGGFFSRSEAVELFKELINDRKKGIEEWEILKKSA